MDHVDRDLHPKKRPAARGTAFYPRKRANAACQVCRARKTKCDNQKPACSYCVSVGATCIQSPVDLSSFDPASLKILERLDDLESLMRRLDKQEARDRVQTSPPGPSYDTTARSKAYTSNAVSAHEDMALRSILPERTECLLQWPLLARHSPGQPVIHSPRWAFHSPPAADTTLAKLLDGGSQGYKEFVDNFFIYVHGKNPIFDETATRRLVVTVLLEGIDWSPHSCLALMICALGRIYTAFKSNYLHTAPATAAYTESQCLFQAAQKRMGPLLSGTEITGAQCLFLSGVYMMCIFRPFQAWRFFSQALAACQMLPFLRRTYDAPEVPTEATGEWADQTQEQAIYWSAWKSERELWRELVLPDFNIPQTTLYPPFFPTPPELCDTMVSERQRMSWLFYLAEISLKRLHGRVCSEMTELHRASRSNAVFLGELEKLMPEYEAQVQQWSDNLPPEFPLAPSKNDEVCSFVLRGHRINFYETLYWPFVMAYLTCQHSGVQMSVCGNGYAKVGLAVHVNRIRVNEPGFRYRHHGTWFMIRTCVRSAGVLLAARTAGCEMPGEWRAAVWKVVEMFDCWEEEMPELLEWRDFMQRALVSLDD